MHPILFKIGSFELHTWGASFAVCILVGTWIAMKRAKKFNLDQAAILDMTLVIVIASVVGSRFWYVVFHLDEFRGHWFDIINPVHDGYFGIAGLSMMGGVAFAVLAALGFALIKKIDFRVLGDAVAPCFLLGAGLQRLFGCHLNGCCFGSPTDSPLGIVFPPGSVAGSVFPGVPLWPAQLFAAALGIIGFILILLLDRKHSFAGYTMWLVLAYYALDRFIVDQFRYYEEAQILYQGGGITINVNHFILFALFAVSAGFWINGRIKSAKNTHKP